MNPIKRLSAGRAFTVPGRPLLGTEPELLFADECHFGDIAADRIARAIAEQFGELSSWAADVAMAPKPRVGATR